MRTSRKTDFRQNKDFCVSKNIPRAAPGASLSVPSFSLECTLSCKVWCLHQKSHNSRTMTSYAAGLWAHLIAGVVFIHVFVVSAGVIVFALIIQRVILKARREKRQERGKQKGMQLNYFSVVKKILAILHSVRAHGLLSVFYFIMDFKFIPATR